MSGRLQAPSDSASHLAETDDGNPCHEPDASVEVANAFRTDSGGWEP